MRKFGRLRHLLGCLAEDVKIIPIEKNVYVTQDRQETGFQNINYVHAIAFAQVIEVSRQ